MRKNHFRKCITLVKVCNDIHLLCVQLTESPCVLQSQLVELFSLIAEINIQFGMVFSSKFLTDLTISLETQGVSSPVEDLVKILRNLRNSLLNVMTDKFKILNICNMGVWRSRSLKSSEILALKNKIIKYCPDVQVIEWNYAGNCVLELKSSSAEAVVECLKSMCIRSNSAALMEVRKLF